MANISREYPFKTPSLNKDCLFQGNEKYQIKIQQMTKTPEIYISLVARAAGSKVGRSSPVNYITTNTLTC